MSGRLRKRADRAGRGGRRGDADCVRQPFEFVAGRAAGRRKEIAVRVALGAGRWRLVRQMLTESLVLSFCGRGSGAGFGSLATRAFAATPNLSLPMLQYISVDRTAMVFTLLTAILTALVFGIVPALQQSRGDLNESLKDSSRGSSGGQGVDPQSAGGFRSRDGVRAAGGRGAADPEFHAGDGCRHGLSAAARGDIARGSSSNLHGADQVIGYFNEVLRRTREIPGVDAAGLTDVLPLGKNRSWGVAAKGQIYTRDSLPARIYSHHQRRIFSGDGDSDARGARFYRA